MLFWKSKAGEPDATRKRRIAIIDDNVDLCTRMMDWLSLSGFDALYATNGRDGWKLIQQEKPDLIILDVNMAGLDGYQVCRLMRTHHATKTIPVVMLTGMTTMGEVEESFKAGANDYIQKPFDWWRLHKKMCALLNLPAPPQS